MAAPDLGERAPRRQPGRDRDAQQVEHVGQLGLDRGAARAGAAAQPQVRARNAAAGAPSTSAAPSRPGAGPRAPRPPPARPPRRRS